MGDLIRKRGNEFGAVTGRPRRCGWFDAPLLRYTAAINGFDSLVVTKLDVLDEFEEIPVCVGYRRCGRELCRNAVYRGRNRNRRAGLRDACRAGSPPHSASIRTNELPPKAKDYLAFLEKRMGVEVGCISTGPERNQTIVRPGSRLEKLIG